MTALRRRIVGLLACLLILGILIGLPALLLAVGTNPLADGLPSLDQILTALTTPDDGTLVLTLIAVLGWVSWAILALLIVLEMLSAVRGIRTPKLPGLRLPQNAVRNLVSAALLLFVTAPLGAGIAHASPAPPAASAPATPQSTSAAAMPTEAERRVDVDQASRPTDKPASKQTVKYTVKPGDSLWSIAEKKLGDGRKYREIIATNTKLLGGKANFISPGWVLTIELPDSAGARGQRDRPAKTVVVQQGDTLSSIAAAELGDTDRYDEIFQASRHIDQPNGAHLTDPDIIDVGWTLKIPAQKATDHPTRRTSTPEKVDQPSTPHTQSRPGTNEQEPSGPKASPRPTVSASPQPQAGGESTEQVPPVQVAPADQADQLHEEPSWVARTPYGLGALLAAGVIVLISTRRRAQQRRRRIGQRLPLPAGHSAEVEHELRATADQMSVETVDVALRALARDCAGSGTPLPAVRAARLTANQFDLYLAEPAQLPSPWTGTADTTVWTLESGHADQLAELDVSAVPAPWPALVTVGHDEENGHVLLDLEHLGALGVTGDPDTIREVFAALAIELATSAWADDLQVTLVGAFPELEDTLQSGRIRYLPSVGRVLDDLAARASRDRQALAAEAVDDLHTARIAGIAPDAWVPEIVLIAGEITSRQRTQLEQLVDDLPRVALAFVTGGSAINEWSLNLHPGDRDSAILAPVDLRLQPQRIPAEQYADLLQIAALSDIDEVTVPTDHDPTHPEVVGSVRDNDNASPPALATDPAAAVTTVQVSAHSTSAAAAPTTHLDPLPASPASSHDKSAQELTEVLDETEENADVASSAEANTAHEDGEEPSPPSVESQTTAHAPVNAAAEILPMLTEVPRVNVLGPVEMVAVSGKVEPSKRARLLELAAYLALHPGATHSAIDDAIWPDRKTEDNLNTRNTATSKLRRWVGVDPDGQDYLPRHQPGEGYGFLPAVRTDVQDWDDLLQGNPLRASTENLEAALQLVRGIPFEGTHPRRYVWSEPTKQRLISEIVDASYELGRRRLMTGRWRAADQALVVGLRIEPAQENLWRLRILAAHESRNPAAENEAIERLLTITEQIDCELEPETEELIAALKKPGTDLDQFLPTAL